MIESFLSAVGLTKVATIPGFFGSLLSLKFVTGLTPWQGAFVIAFGTLCAGYLAPLMVNEEWFSPKSEAPIGFLIGLLSMAIMAAVVKEVPSIVVMAKEKILK